MRLVVVRVQPLLALNEAVPLHCCRPSSVLLDTRAHTGAVTSLVPSPTPAFPPPPPR